MAQYLKEDVQRRIEAAALACFADVGYERATIGQIAKRAGISTGNVYRYYESKAVLFDAVVSEGLAASLKKLLRQRMKALSGVDPARQHRRASQELMEFSIEHRLQVVVLLGRNRGSRYHGFEQSLVQELVELALEHFRARAPKLLVSPAQRFSLQRIYRNLVETMVEVLANFEDRAAIIEATATYSRYHLAGLEHLLP